MKWFEKEEIRDSEHLTQEQIDYLSRPSLTAIFPFNCIFRKHFDYLLVFILLVAGEKLLNRSESLGIPSLLCLAINFILLGVVNYFFIRHGRRLAWNRSKWKTFEAFQKSEYVWTSALIGFMVMLLPKLKNSVYDDLANNFIEILIVLVYIVLILFLPYLNYWLKKGKKATTSAKPDVYTSELKN